MSETDILNELGSLAKCTDNCYICGKVTCGACQVGMKCDKICFCDPKNSPIGECSCCPDKNQSPLA